VNLRFAVAAATGVFIVFHCSSAQAQMPGIPNLVPCTAANSFTGAIVPVRQRTGFSQHWAHAAWDPDGWPAITYGPSYFGLPPVMQRLTSGHECGHLVRATTDEFEANCFSLRGIQFSPQERQQIGQYISRFGPLPQQYGGSGQAFWDGTRELCPEATD
jgi:hypothetical protein